MNIDLQFFVGLIFSFLDFTGLTLLSLAIYRIPIMMYWKRLLVIQFVLIATMLLHDYVIMNSDYYALSIAGVGIVLLTSLLKIPLLYSSLIWGTGYLLTTLIQAGLIILVTFTGVLTLEDLQREPMYSNGAMLLSFLISLTVVYFIDKKRLGFMFIMNRFRLQKRNLQWKDIFIAVFFVCVVSLIQFGILSFKTNAMNNYLVIILGIMIVISLIGLYITYIFNMREIDERFNNFRRKKL